MKNSSAIFIENCIYYKKNTAKDYFISFRVAAAQ